MDLLDTNAFRSIPTEVLDNLRTWGVQAPSLVAFTPGAMNGDGKLDGLDVQLFINAVLANSTDPADLYITDFSGDNVVDEADMPIFVDALLGE